MPLYDVTNICTNISTNTAKRHPAWVKGSRDVIFRRLLQTKRGVSNFQQERGSSPRPFHGGGVEFPDLATVHGAGVEFPDLATVHGGGVEFPDLATVHGGGVEFPDLATGYGGGVEVTGFPCGGVTQRLFLEQAPGLLAYKRYLATSARLAS